MLAFGVEQPSVGTADAIGPQRLFEIVRLEEHGEAGQRALLDRRGRQRGQRRPEMFLHLRRDRDALAGKDGGDPVGGPGTLGYVVNACERLEETDDAAPSSSGATEVVPIAAHGERGRADRAAEVEGEDLGMPG
jgi:hypothetical protein